MGTSADSSYPDVDRALKRFEAYVQQLPIVRSLPASPNACVPMNAHEFVYVANAMRQLPVCTAPQLVNSQLQKQITGLQERYVAALKVCLDKGIISGSSHQAVVSAVSPHRGYTHSSPSAGSEVTASASKGFFAFGQNTQEAKKPGPSIFSTVRRLVAPAA